MFRLSAVQKQKIARAIGYEKILFVKRRLNLNRLFASVIYPTDAEKRLFYLKNEQGSSPDFAAMEAEIGPEARAGYEAQWAEYLKRPFCLREYFLEIENAWIEPDQGWAFFRRGNHLALIFDSIPFNGWKESYWPSWPQIRSMTSDKTAFETIETAYSLNITKGGESNYWHFMSDILGQLILLDEMCADHEIPIIVSKELTEKAFFKKAVADSDSLQKRRWIVRDRPFHVKKLFCGQSILMKKGNGEKIHALLKGSEKAKSGGRKVFLTRGRNRIRSIQNIAEVEILVKKRGFEVVDCDLLSGTEQENLFSEAGEVIGIHGAGLTNLIYRKGQSCRVLEIFPADYIQYFYKYWCAEFGFEHVHFLGSKYDSAFMFGVDVAVFEKALDSFSRK